MASSLVCVLLATSLVVFTLCPPNTYAGRWICEICQNQEECDADPGLCMWGETRDACNRRICAKGPGQRCGGVLDYQGKCAEGLMCLNNKCRGCYIQTVSC